jgi:hypothetical protein
VIEYLPSKCKALDLNFSTAKNIYIITGVKGAHICLDWLMRFTWREFL